MHDVFISYAAKDRELAGKLCEDMTSHGINVFLAEISIEPGKKWKDSIIQALAESKWVFFLATPESCASTAVMHELGGALFGRKELVTVLCGTAPNQLPEWIRDAQAIDVRKRDDLLAKIQKIGEAVRSDRFITGLVAGGLLAFGVWALASGKSSTAS